jgi:hypothetical protein
MLYTIIEVYENQMNKLFAVLIMEYLLIQTEGVLAQYSHSFQSQTFCLAISVAHVKIFEDTSEKQ